LYPITVEVLAFQDSVTVWPDVPVPVPCKLAFTAVFEALFANDTLAFAVPALCGANVTANETDLPALRVTGRVRPEREYSLLLKLADFTVTLAPVAAKAPESIFLDPTATLPKLSVVGDTDTVPLLVPVPASPMFSVGFTAFDDTVI
jgi:hypothetical protein